MKLTENIKEVVEIVLNRFNFDKVEKSKNLIDDYYSSSYRGDTSREQTKNMIYSAIANLEPHGRECFFDNGIEVEIYYETNSITNTEDMIINLSLVLERVTTRIEDTKN